MPPNGFNFYYAAVKDTPYEWMDIAQMCRLILPRESIHRIKYLTANITARQGDPDQAVRQQTYLRALRAIPNLTIILGHFLTYPVWMPLANMIPGKSGYVQVLCPLGKRE
jgi:hypothetical protein